MKPGFALRELCPGCDGEGTYADGDECEDCHGRGSVVTGWDDHDHACDSARDRRDERDNGGLD